MNCPVCDHNKTEVMSTEKFKGHVSRIRRCSGCGQVMMTLEQIESVMTRTQPPKPSIYDSPTERGKHDR